VSVAAAAASAVVLRGLVLQGSKQGTGALVYKEHNLLLHVHSPSSLPACKDTHVKGHSSRAAEQHP
jgi:hypothetical protein